MCFCPLFLGARRVDQLFCRLWRSRSNVDDAVGMECKTEVNERIGGAFPGPWVFIVAARLLRIDSHLFGAYSPVLGFSHNRSDLGSKLIPYFDAVTFLV